MLGRLQNKLYNINIPRLIDLETEVPLKTGDIVGSYRLYSLGWDEVDRAKKRNHLDWLRNTGVDFNHIPSWYPEILPRDLDTTINGLRFAISSTYRAEIYHYSQLYLVEWSRDRPFDTMIRSMCLRPAIAAINCALKLLADCIYNQATSYWMKEITFPNGLRLNKRAIQCLLLYKFWKFCTGDGVVWENSEFDRLEKHTRTQSEVNRKCMTRSDYTSDILRLLTLMRDWEDRNLDIIETHGPSAKAV